MDDTPSPGDDLLDDLLGSSAPPGAGNSDTAEAAATSSSASTTAAGTTSTSTVRDSGVSGRDFGVAPAPDSSTGASSDNSAATPTADDKDDGLSLSGLVGRFKIWSRKVADDVAEGSRKIKQQLSEKVGQSSKTEDVELTEKIATARSVESQWRQNLQLLHKYKRGVSQLAQAQLAISACYAEMTGTVPELKATLACQQRVFDVFSKNAVGVVEAIQYLADQMTQFFKGPFGTLWPLVDKYESARVAYDAYRHEYEKIKDGDSPRLATAEKRFLDAYNVMTAARAEAIEALDRLHGEYITTAKYQLAGFSNALSMATAGDSAGFSDAIRLLQHSESSAQATNMADDGSPQSPNAAPF